MLAVRLRVQQRRARSLRERFRAHLLQTRPRYQGDIAELLGSAKKRLVATMKSQRSFLKLPKNGLGATKELYVTKKRLGRTQERTHRSVGPLKGVPCLLQQGVGDAAASLLIHRTPPNDSG